jgi:propionyl-CoA synthetase
VIDTKGYLHIMTRLDDVINTAGHRISTGRLEEVVNEHDQVVESAVIVYNHEVRGECALAFSILRGSGDRYQEENEKIAKDINIKVRTDVGAF